ncbi:MAG: hypothetical protein U0840_18380 [Gemmataceae bacterium]
MLSLHSPRRPGIATFRPTLETLEERVTPTGRLPVGPPLPPMNLTLNVSYGVGRQVTLSGDLMGSGDVANVAISITGSATGQTSTDADGEYSLTVEASNLGMVTATAGDGLASAWSEITDEPPVITDFEAIEGADRVWTFRGTLTYHRYFDSLQVFFGGQPVSIVNQSTSANNTGYFELVLVLNGQNSDNGQVWAQGQSAFGLLSDMAFDYVHQTT